MYLLEPPGRGDLNENTQHNNLKVHKLSPFVSWPDAMINPQCLELPISKTNYSGPEEVRVIEICMLL